jgi:hypothetical protein
MPRYRTVPSSLVWPRRSCTALRFLVAPVDTRRLGPAHRMRTVGRRIEIDLLHPNIDNAPTAWCRDAVMHALDSGTASTASRVGVVISYCTGGCVCCCNTIALAATRSPWQTSRSVASRDLAVLQRFRSRHRPSTARDHKLESRSTHVQHETHRSPLPGPICGEPASIECQDVARV